MLKRMGYWVTGPVTSSANSCNPDKAVKARWANSEYASCCECGNQTSIP